MKHTKKSILADVNQWWHMSKARDHLNINTRNKDFSLHLDFRI